MVAASKTTHNKQWPSQRKVRFITRVIITNNNNTSQSHDRYVIDHSRSQSVCAPVAWHLEPIHKSVRSRRSRTRLLHRVTVKCYYCNLSHTRVISRPRETPMERMEIEAKIYSQRQAVNAIFRVINLSSLYASRSVDSRYRAVANNDSGSGVSADVSTHKYRLIKALLLRNNKISN